MLEHLARRCGIVESYVDARGRERATLPQTRAALIAAMGFDGSSEAGARRAVLKLNRHEWTRVLPPVVVHRSPGPPEVDISLAARIRRVDWSVTLEDGRRIDGRADVERLEVIARAKVDGIEHRRLRLRLDGDFPHGYHLLRVRPGGVTMPLIVAPAKCWVPPEISAGARFWGVTTQLYLSRSRRNWGIGDFGDLRALVDILRPLGADVIGLNPLHALFPDDPEHASPYSPASRLLLNVLNIDVAQLAAQLKDGEAKRLIGSAAFRRRLSRCRRARQVRYTDVAALKLPALRILFDGVRSQTRSASWRAYKKFEARGQRGGQARLCVHGAARAFRDAGVPSRGLARMAAGISPSRIAGGQALRRRAPPNSWISNAGCSTWRIRSSGRPPSPQARWSSDCTATWRWGRIRPGAETWSNQRSVVSTGADRRSAGHIQPARTGLGLAAVQSDGVARGGISGIHRSGPRQHASRRRLAHRSRDGIAAAFLGTRGAGHPSEGTYVQYPIDDLVGILALESHRQQCLVVGEDLGTVPAGFRERMAAANVLSYRVLILRARRAGIPAARTLSGTRARGGEQS